MNDPPPWEAYRDEELDPAVAERLLAALQGPDAELELQRALTAWSANALAGDVRRAFLARVADHPVATPPRRGIRRSRRPSRRWLPWAAAALLLAAVWFGLTGPWRSADDRPPHQDPAVLRAVPAATATIAGRPVVGDHELAPGAELVTAPGGSVHLELGASRIQIGHPTATTRLSLQRTESALIWDLAAGRLALDVRRPAAAPPWRLRLPQAEIRVVGTRFILDAAEQRWRVAVHAGQVLVDGRGRSPFPTQRLDGGAQLWGDATTRFRRPLPAPDARPVVLLTDRLHADDTTALLYALLSPRLAVRSILITWDGQEQTALAAWCADLGSALGSEDLVIARGGAGRLTQAAAPLSPAARRLVAQATAATAAEPLLLLSLGTSRSVVAEVLRQRPDLAARMTLIEPAAGNGEAYGQGRDPLADTLVEARDLRRSLVRVSDPRSLSAWPAGPLRPLFSRAGPAAASTLIDAAVVAQAEALAAGATLPTRIDGTALITDLIARWRQRGPKAVP